MLTRCLKRNRLQSLKSKYFIICVGSKKRLTFYSQSFFQEGKGLKRRCGKLLYARVGQAVPDGSLKLQKKTPT